MPIDRLVNDASRRKAKAMLRKADWRDYARTFARELGSVEKAFLAGAIDSVVFDVSAMLRTRRIASHDDRKKLIKDVLKEMGVDKS